MLSDSDLRAAIKAGDLEIVPFTDAFLRPAGVVLRLGAELLRPLAGKVVDVKNNIVPDYEEILMTDSGYVLEPGGFVLGHTFESVTVGSKYGLLIEGRSTLARVGLTIVQTAMLVYPGHRKRSITLEVANHGPNPIILYPMMKIARAAILELKTPTKIQYDDAGKYRFQSSVGIPIFKDEIVPEEPE